MNTQIIVEWFRDGTVLVEKTCWGCGEVHEIKVPLDDVNMKETEAKMCGECVQLFKMVDGPQ